MRTENAIRFYRLYSKKDVEICFYFSKNWFKEQLEGYDHYDEWFAKHANGCRAESHYHGTTIHHDAFFLWGKGVDVVKFLKEYSHVIDAVEHILVE